MVSSCCKEGKSDFNLHTLDKLSVQVPENNFFFVQNFSLKIQLRHRPGACVGKFELEKIST